MKLSIQFRMTVLGLLSSIAPAYAGPDFDFSFFRFRTGTTDFSMPLTVRDTESIDAPQNPIDVLQDTMLGSNFSRTRLDVGWSGYSGVFNSAIDQHIEDIDFLTSYRIDLDFHADIDLMLNVDLDIDYATPAGQLVLVTTNFLVGNETTSEELINARFDGGGSALEPPVGSFNLQDQVLLTAGSDYDITLSVRGLSVSALPPMTTPIDITGFVNFSINPVPEPHTALLLLFGTGAIHRRRRHRKVA